MERAGNETQSGLVFVLNNSGHWNGREVVTKWPLKQFVPLAWNGNNINDTPENKSTNENGAAEFWAPPRGYAVYIYR
jgi:alpha-amylase